MGSSSRTAWGWPDVAVTFGLWLLLAVAGLVVVEVVPGLDVTDPWTVVVLVALPWVGLLGWPLLATSRRGQGPVHELGLRCTGRQALLGVLGGAVTVVCALAVAAATAVVTGSPPTSTAGDVAAELAAAGIAPVLALAVLAAFAGPVAEEVAFRGLLYRRLERAGRSQVTCVLVTAMAFAAFHLEPERFPLLLSSGIVLGVVRAWTGSTGAAVVAHVVNNVPAAFGLVVLATQP